MTAWRRRYLQLMMLDSPVLMLLISAAVGFAAGDAVATLLFALRGAFR